MYAKSQKLKCNNKEYKNEHGFKIVIVSKCKIRHNLFYFNFNLYLYDKSIIP